MARQVLSLLWGRDDLSRNSGNLFLNAKALLVCSSMQRQSRSTAAETTLGRMDRECNCKSKCNNKSALLIPSGLDTAKHPFTQLLKEGQIYSVYSNTMCHTEALNHWFLSGQIHFSPQTVSPPPQCMSRQQRPLAESGLVGKWECGD